MKTRKIFSYIIIIMAFVFGSAVYLSLPARIPVHIGLTGEIDRWASKTPNSVFGLPLLMLGLYLLFRLAPRIDPFRKNYQKFADTYDLFINSIIGFLGILYVLFTLAALMPKLDVSLGTNVGLGLLLIVVGNFLGRVKRNFFLGIRTPWTLSNEEVWARTHRLGARMMVAAGLVVVVSAVLFRTEIALTILLVAIVVTTVLLVAYSYLLFRKIGHVEL